MAFSTKLALSAFVLAGTVLAQSQQMLQPIEMKGSKLFYKNGTQFFMKGVAYQQDTAAAGATNEITTKYKDPLADEANCKRDVPLLAEAGTNTIRTYAIDPKADHDACMNMLQQAGIYVICDLSEPAISINRDDPQWNTEIYQRYVAVIDVMSKYSNVIGFFAGNEVSNNKTNTGASSYVKAAVRDTKAYIKKNKDRWLGVGYAANDDADIRKDIADFFNCADIKDAIDYWGYNIYSWCGDSNMQTSGYTRQIGFFQDYSVPVFFAEYGCNDVPSKDPKRKAAQRKFLETKALYGDEMSAVFSGGIVYMYFQEDNDYGLVDVTGGTVSKLQPAFNNLKTQVTEARPKAIDRDSYTPTNKPQSCPAVVKGQWEAHPSLPPTPDQNLCDCMVKSRTCVKQEGLPTESYNDLFGTVCGLLTNGTKAGCKAINGNAAIGVFGAYSMCPDSAKLDYVLDAYYVWQNKAADACKFDGQARIQKPETEDSCKAKLGKADDINKQVATATTAFAGPTSTDTEEEGLAGPRAAMARIMSVGDYAVGLYMVVALLTGVGIIAL